MSDIALNLVTLETDVQETTWLRHVPNATWAAFYVLWFSGYTWCHIGLGLWHAMTSAIIFCNQNATMNGNQDDEHTDRSFAMPTLQRLPERVHGISSSDTLTLTVSIIHHRPHELDHATVCAKKTGDRHAGTVQ